MNDTPHPTSAAAIDPRSSGPGFVGYAGYALGAVFFFYAWILRVSPSVMVDALMRDFAVSGAVLGNLSAFYFYAYAALQMPVGMAFDRWGPRKVMSWGVLLAGVGCLIFASAPSVEIAYLGRTLIGAGAAFGLLGGMVLAGAWFSPRRFAMLSGLLMTTGLLGGIVGQAPMAVLVEVEGWRRSIIYLGLFALLLGLVMWLVIRDRPPRMSGASAASASSEHPGAVAETEGVLAALWRVAKHRQTIAIAFFSGLIASPMLAFGALWGVPYAQTRFGVERPAAAFATSTLLLGFVVGGPLCGWLSDRIGRRKVPLVLGASLGGVAITAALYLPGVSFEAYHFLLFVTGFASTGMVVAYALTREHNAGGGTGAALGLVNMAAVMGGAVFQPVVGLLLDLQWGGTLKGGARVYDLAAYDNALLTMPALYLAALFFAFVIRETWCRPVGPPPRPARATT
ncbi:MAG: MFS transporter [Alphaproteobacteria bacterium]|nr:MFS transporter [Alphaproteobacteria bacterium]